MSAVDPGAGTEAPEYPKLPPVTEIGMASLALILAGAIYMVISLPEKVSLAPAIVLLVLSVALIGVNLVLLSRAKGFAWGRFFQIARYTLAAYVIEAALIEYVFLHNHLSGGSLVVLTLSIVVFAVNVPVLVGFTVARFHLPAAPAE